MNKEEFIRRLQVSLEANARELYSPEGPGDPRGELVTPLSTLVQAIQNIHTIGEAFQLMQDLSYDSASATVEALRIFLPDARDEDWDGIPFNGWST